jgi:MoxR-like ATPase
VKETEFLETFASAEQELEKAIFGQADVVRHTLVSLIAGGHILVEGVPGLGKTLLVRALALLIGKGFGRIQFTPDLMPSDVTGGNVYSAKSGTFEFMPGPIFNELVLADEVNRAPAKTQAALLEAMQERAVTIDGTTRKLPSPFLVLATQNPIESQGTYPLPEAQLDRFLLKVNVDYPTMEVEKSLLSAYLQGFDPGRLQLQPILGGDRLALMKALSETVTATDDILDYITRLVGATRDHRSLEVGASPRASIGMLKVARVAALIAGRDFLVPDDVKTFAHAVLRHRITLHPDAELEGMTNDGVVDAIIRETSVPGGIG